MAEEGEEGNQVPTSVATPPAQPIPEGQAEKERIDEFGEYIPSSEEDTKETPYLREGTGIKYTGTSGGGAVQLGGRKSWATPKYMIEAAEAAIEHHYNPESPAPEFIKVKGKGGPMGGKYGEEIEREMTPKEKAEKAFKDRVTAEAAQEAAAKAQGAEPILKPQRGLGLEARYKQGLIQKQEQEAKYREAQIEAELKRQERLGKEAEATAARAEARFQQEQQEYERKRKQEELTRQATFPRTAADIKLANIKAMRATAEAEKEENKKQFEESRLGRFLVGGQKLGNEIINAGTKIASAPGIAARATSDILQNAAENIKPNLQGLEGQVIAQPQTSNVQRVAPVSGYQQAAQDIGGYGPSFTTDQVLEKIGSTTGATLGSRQDALQEIGGPVVHRIQG